jgi:5-methylcytosine-specific restriction endonuclease McrA
MRRLEKRTEPEVLIANGEQWTRDYVQARALGTEKKHERWRHEDIRSRLSVETIKKCAYCEGFVGDVTYPHVEHIKPKSHFPELAHRWPNLTRACETCNKSKGDYYHEDLAVLNPYEDEINDHLDFFGGIVTSKSQEGRGEITRTLLGLNRIDLTYSRLRRLLSIEIMYDKWKAAEEPLRGVLAKGIRSDVLEGEFTATATRFLEHVGFPLSGDSVDG